MASNLAKQAFAKDIQNGLWPLNDFLSQSKDDTMFVNDDKVNLPHAGTSPAVVEGRTVVSTPEKRGDSASQYPLAELSTDATWLQYSEELIVNYNKRESILSEHRSALQKALAEKVLYKWARGGDSEGPWTTKPAKVMTLGTTARAVSLPTVGATAASGTRKPVLFSDILNVVNALNNADVPGDGRIAVIPASFFGDILNIAEFKSADYVNVKPLPGAPLSFGWLGMTWYVRSFVTRWDKTATPYGLDDPTEDTVATDCAGGIFYHKNFVRTAKGDVKVFLNTDMANLYGSQMSAVARYGAIGARVDGKGIVNLIETFVS